MRKEEIIVIFGRSPVGSSWCPTQPISIPFPASLSGLECVSKGHFIIVPPVPGNSFLGQAEFLVFQLTEEDFTITQSRAES